MGFESLRAKLCFEITSIRFMFCSKYVNSKTKNNTASVLTKNIVKNENMLQVMATWATES